MSSSAGRVLLIPKGEYNSTTQYSSLDVVLYEHDSYVALQTTQGNAPTNTTYWQKLTDVGEDLDELNEALTDEAETRSAMGAKNLLEPVKGSDTSHGVILTKQTDGSYIISGSMDVGTSYTIFTLNNIMKVERGKTYTLSGGISNRFYLEAWSGSDFDVKDYGSGVSFTPSADETINCAVIIYSDAVLPQHIYPMIRLATDTDPTYQPYAMTNKELTDAYELVTANVTVPTTYVYNAGSALLAFRKRNGVVSVNHQGAVMMFPAQDTDYVIGDIPSGFMPNTTRYFACIDISSFNKGVLFTLNSTDGKIHAKGYNTGTNGIVNQYTEMVYII